MRVPLKAGLLSSIEPEADPRLLGARCSDCRQIHFPATDSCPYCSGQRCDTVRLSDRGRLYVYTAVEKPPPGYQGRVPYGFGVVELPEGLRVVSRLTEPRIDRLAIGMPMRLVLEEIFTNQDGDAVVGWAFSPEAS
jgi:uncharacterized OB-fold protein